MSDAEQEYTNEADPLIAAMVAEFGADITAGLTIGFTFVTLAPEWFAYWAAKWTTGQIDQDDIDVTRIFSSAFPVPRTEINRPPR